MATVTVDSKELAKMESELVGSREKVEKLKKMLAAEKHLRVRQSKKMPLIELLAKNASMDFLFDFEGERNQVPEGMTKSGLFDALELCGELEFAIDGQTITLEPYGSFNEDNALEVLEDAKTHIEAALIDYELAREEFGG